MPGLQGDNVVASLGSPVKKSKLSLKFFQKKEAKRTLDFSEPPADESKTEPEPEDSIARCDRTLSKIIITIIKSFFFIHLRKTLPLNWYF
jgi:hypothetical protein